MTVDVDNRSCFEILCMEINRAQLNIAGIGLCFELSIMLLFCVFKIETVGVPSCDTIPTFCKHKVETDLFSTFDLEFN